MLKILRGKMSNLSVSAKRNVALVLAATIIASCCGFSYAAPNVITIADAGCAPIQVKTEDTNVGKILSKQGIVLNEGDVLNYALSDHVQSDATIKIYRAADVTLTYMGKTETYRTTKSTVAEVLSEKGIVVDDNDQVTPALESRISSGDAITVVIYDHHTFAVQEDIAYNTIERENTDLAPGERRVVQAGSKGIVEYEYDIWYENGREFSKEVIRETRLAEPVDEIIEHGQESVWELGVVPASKPSKYRKVERYQATAYDASPMDNGIWAGKTSTGMPLVYGVIAVDPRVIPYGTKMYIESVDGKYKYGYAIAGDCGGAIKGKKVDLFFPDRNTCYQFGRRDVNIYFLD